MTVAKWSVAVDWDDDGDFQGAGEDITAEVLGLTLEHMRDLRSGYVRAARLEVEVRNEDHKYSPPNQASPLWGQLQPGRRVWLRAAYPYDALSDTPGTRLSSHTPDYDDSFSWAEDLGGFRVASGGVGVETATAQGGGRCVATMDLGDPDVSVACWFTRGSDGADHGGLCLRLSDAANYLYIQVTGSAVELRQVQSGSDYLVASGSYSWLAGKRAFLQAVLHGDVVRVFVEDRLVLHAFTTFNMEATRHGLFCAEAADHRWEGFGGWASLFYGTLEVIRPRPGRGDRSCYLRAVDDMERMASVTLYTYADSSFPQGAGDILGDILDYAGVDPLRRLIDDGQALVPDTWSPALWDTTASREIYRLQDEEDGLVYVDGHGFWRFEDRGHRSSLPHSSPRATFKDLDDGANPYFSDLVWDDGADLVENVVFLRLRTATDQGAQTVWTLQEKPYFQANETRDFLAESKAYDVVTGLLAPVEDVDYDANTQQDGSGTDISAQLTVSHPATDRYNGKGTLVRVTFGATAGYLTLLKLRANSALVYDDAVLVVEEDAASKGTYGERARAIDARWTREVSVARATALSRLARRKDPRTVLRLTVPNGSRANLMAALHRSVSDRVRVQYPAMGIDQDFFIEGRRVTVSRGWTLVVGEFLLQQA